MSGNVSVWVGDEEMIVSLHFVEAYKRFDFSDRSEYVEFVDLLTERGYRLQ